MIKEPNRLAAARASLGRAEEDLKDPDRLGDLRNAINCLLQVISGVYPRIEKDIARKLFLDWRNKVLAETKAILANLDSYERGYLEHWSKVIDGFVDPSVPDDLEFNAYKKQFLAQSASHPIGILRVAHDDAGKTVGPDAPENIPYLRVLQEIGTMLHAKSLKAIGQSLEMLRLRAFKLAKQGHVYIVSSDSLTDTHEWIVRNSLAGSMIDSPTREQKLTQLTVGNRWLCYGPLDMLRLNALGRIQENRHRLGLSGEGSKLIRLLEALGEHLDSKQAINFEILWTPDSVSVEYQTAKTLSERSYFTFEKLHKLASYSRFRGRRFCEEDRSYGLLNKQPVEP